MLGAREPLAAGPATAGHRGRPRPEDELAEPGRRARLALGIGNAVHAALEWSARRGWRRPPDELLERLLAARALGAGDAEAPRAAALVAGWLDSPLLRASSVTASGRAPRSRSCSALGRDGVRGQIDLLAESADARADGGRLQDRRARRPRAGRARRALRAQREVYALAGGGERRRARAATSSSRRPTEPVEALIGADGLGGARASAWSALSSGCARASSSPTAEPYAALCLRLPGGGAPVPAPEVAAARH